MSSLTRASNPSSGGGIRIATGTYTGNGNATQAITGVGFQPKYLQIYNINGGNDANGEKTDQDGIKTKMIDAALAFRYDNDMIISLDADGFTVGDGTGYPFGNCFNINNIGYSYCAWG